MEQWMWLVWLGMFVLSLILEASTEALVSIWFAAGALASLGCSFIPGLPYWGEVIIFFAISLIAFFAIRPFLSRFQRRKRTPTNVDALIGSKGIMKLGTDEWNVGEVELRGAIWTAVSVNEKISISEGEHVRVVAVSGNKLIVEKED